MSCESGGVKVDHACSGPIVDSFGSEYRPLRLSRLECESARARCPSSVAPGSPSQSRITGMCDASGASSVQPTSTAHGLAAMISTTASGFGARKGSATYMAGRNVITRQALRPNDRTQTLTTVQLDSPSIKLRSAPLARRVPPAPSQRATGSSVITNGNPKMIFCVYRWRPRPPPY
jgi:hypothetical protein